VTMWVSFNDGIRAALDPELWGSRLVFRCVQQEVSGAIHSGDSVGEEL
jgi:hypothetical protein